MNMSYPRTTTPPPRHWIFESSAQRDSAITEINQADPQSTVVGLNDTSLLLRSSGSVNLDMKLTQLLEGLGGTEVTD